MDMRRIIIILCCLILLGSARGETLQEQQAGKYMAVGFDDLPIRESVASFMLPLFQEYGVSATFTHIKTGPFLGEEEIATFESLIGSGSELGDHTWFHVSYPYGYPLCNGQDPAHPEGSQEPFPTNDQLREDTGDGTNAFGLNLMSPVSDTLGYLGIASTWGGLTDEECQRLRNDMSIYQKTEELQALDYASELYLGTEGTSFGSWDDEEGCYTGGIFTGCKTSCNHEIWERILEITQAMYQEMLDDYLIEGQDQMWTWSWPGGSMHELFLFHKDGKKYYDPECTKPYNYLSRFTSSCLTDENGMPLERSFTEALRNSGYRMTHDTIYPGRSDGQSVPVMRRQMILNASLSRQDALAFSTDRFVESDDIASEYPDDFFDDHLSKSRAAQMYDSEGAFFRFLEALRKDTANGVVHGEVNDPTGSESDNNFWRAVLDYCRFAGVQVVSKKQAYDICFGETEETGNLIYNPGLRNTAEEFMPDADKVPSYPDGYEGACSVVRDPEPRLVIAGETRYLHFGIPLGELVYRVQARGDGKIRICAVRNEDDATLDTGDLQVLAEYTVGTDDFQEVAMPFRIEDAPLEAYEERCEGWGKKITAILILMDGDMEIREIQLTRPAGE